MKTNLALALLVILQIEVFQNSRKTLKKHIVFVMCWKSRNKEGGLAAHFSTQQSRKVPLFQHRRKLEKLDCCSWRRIMMTPC